MMNLENCFEFLQTMRTNHSKETDEFMSTIREEIKNDPETAFFHILKKAPDLAKMEGDKTDIVHRMYAFGMLTGVILSYVSDHLQENETFLHIKKEMKKKKQH